jgi:hypothetical protein
MLDSPASETGARCPAIDTPVIHTGGVTVAVVLWFEARQPVFGGEPHDADVIAIRCEHIARGDAICGAKVPDMRQIGIQAVYPV